MGTTLAIPRYRPLVTADGALKAAAAFWFIVAVAGQVIFALSIAMFYGLTALRGDLHLWNKHLSHGYIPGDRAGNAALIVHLISAALITLSGAIQFIPQIRSHAPKFHRWNGRVYIVTAFTVSLAGLYVELARGLRTGFAQQFGQGFLAVLIMVCAVIAVRFAIKGDYVRHRRWAFRLFLTVSAALFIRAGIVLSAILLGGSFELSVIQGTVLTIFTYAQYCVPLAVLEVYFWTQSRPGALRRFAMAAALVILTLVMGAGIAAASVAIFVPSIRTALDHRHSIAGALEQTIRSGGIDAAVLQFHRLQAAQPTTYNFDEDELNILGYDLIRAHKYPEAIRILQLNTEAYPKSSNTWDSLGEAYMDNGQAALAIANYRKSLAINPANQNGAMMLHKLGAN